MKPEIQRIEIAKLDGWILKPAKGYTNQTPVWHDSCGWPHEPKRFNWNDSEPVDSVLPDYLNDLDAIHDLENGLSEENASIYAQFLYDIAISNSHKDGVAYLKFWYYIHSNSKEKCEAYLRTFNKWED